MSKIIYVYFRDGRDHSETIQRLLDLIAPQDVANTTNRVYRSENTHIGVLNFNHSIQVHTESLVNYVSSQVPSENAHGGEDMRCYYSILRKATTIIVNTDIVSSKTLWYVVNGSFFAISTSQRMLIGLMGDFQFNPNILPWMLASGIICNQSWDLRITCLPPSQELNFNVKEWKISFNQKETPVFRGSSNLPKNIYELTHAIQDCIPFTEDSEKIGLPISGGYDSRFLLILSTKLRKKITCITWDNLEEGKKNKFSDLSVAKLLVSYYGVEHLCFDTERDRNLSPAQILSTFLEQGEGRVDHIGAHLDGFQMWARISKGGIRIIFRGDEGFGWLPVQNADDVLRGVGLQNLTDFFSKADIAKFGLQCWDQPAFLARQRNESLASWRDRMYHSFRLPYIICPLNDIISGYVEVKTPFLNREILALVRQLPDELRTDKRFFKRLVLRVNPAIAFSKNYAAKSLEDLFTEDFRKYFQEELSGATAELLFNSSFLSYVRSGLREDNTGAAPNRRMRILRAVIAKQTPRWIKSKLRNIFRPKLSALLLAYRVVLICCMYDMLSKDSTRLNDR